MKKNSVKKLCLGTAQLGMHYGVNNALGRQPSQEESFVVLQTALEAGIVCFDSASAYGNAEEVLGRFGLASKQTKTGEFTKIISKLSPHCENNANAVLHELQSSLQRLQTHSIEGYMLHRTADMHRRGIMDGLMQAKRLGLVNKIGISIYEPEDAIATVHDDRFDMIQIPFNVLDTRLEKAGFFLQAKENGVEVYARSAFLQGLLLMNPEVAESKVHGSGIFVQQFQAISQEHGFAAKEAAFLFCYCCSGIDFVVFGVDDSKQLQENCAMIAKEEAFHTCYETLKDFFITSDVPREIIMPSLWNQLNNF